MTCISFSVLQLLPSISELHGDDLGYTSLSNTQMISVNTGFLTEHPLEFIQQIKTMLLKSECAPRLRCQSFKKITCIARLIGSNFKNGPVSNAISKSYSAATKNK